MADSPMERAVRFEIRGHIEAILKEAQGRATPGADGWPVVDEAVLTHWSDALAHMVFHRLEGQAVLEGRVVELEQRGWEAPNGALLTLSRYHDDSLGDEPLYRVKQHTEGEGEQMARIGDGRVESTGWATGGGVQHYAETIAYPRYTGTFVPCGSTFMTRLPDGWEVKREPYKNLAVCKKPTCQAAFAKRERADA